jgi:putative toxin-antitoxin system antitoxin component (TIGR02293 family)
MYDYPSRRLSFAVFPHKDMLVMMNVAEVARVWTLAVDVWGDEVEARGFLFRPHAMLDDKRPIDVLIQSESGAEMVIDILSGLKYGSAA